jgi:TPR repeat protein
VTTNPFHFGDTLHLQNVELRSEVLANGLSIALIEGDYTGDEELAQVIPELAELEELKDQVADENPEAFLTLAKCCTHGATFCRHSTGNRVVRIHAVPEHAFALYKLAADFGLAEAQYQSGSRYERGEGVSQSLEKAFQYYERAAAQDHTLGALNLGVLLLGSEEVDKQKQGIQWMQKAADQGEPVAYSNLGDLWRLGQAGLPQNDGKCFEMYEKAAGIGHVESQFQLGLMYNEGIAVPQNQEKAVECFAACADEGMPEALYILGALATRDGALEAGFKFFLKAARTGHHDSQFNVARCYAYGEGVEPDLHQAYFWARIVEDNDPEATKLVGLIREDLSENEIAALEKSLQDQCSK